MSHTARICFFIAATAPTDFKQLSTLHAQKIAHTLFETMTSYDPTNIQHQPHIFNADLDRWAYVTRRIQQQESGSQKFLELSAQALFKWSMTLGDIRHTRPEDHAYRYENRGAIDPLAASARGIKEAQTWGEMACRRALREFYRSAQRDRVIAISVLESLQQDGLTQIADLETLSLNLRDQYKARFDVFAPDKILRKLAEHKDQKLPEPLRATPIPVISPNFPEKISP